MSAPLLLDTCALIWLANDEAVSDALVAALSEAQQTDQAIYLSPISAWEVGLLVSRGRVTSPISPGRWFELFLRRSGTRLVELSPDILIASSFLPGTPPRDPADRIIAATAREHGYRIVTRDRLLLSYSEQGHVQTLPC